MYRILGDLHTHTLYFRHAYSTIQENVTAAAARGIEVLGSSDHFSSMLFADPHLRNFQFFMNQEIWPRQQCGVTVLRACEADIVTLQGGLFGEDISTPQNIVGKPYGTDKSLFERVTESLDYVIASVHNADFTQGARIAQTTDMYVSVLENSSVFILGHTGRSGVPYDVDTVLTCAKDHHKLIEINEHSFSGKGASDTSHTCRHIAERCAELGVGICVNSDAHVAPQIGAYSRTCSLLEEIHFPEELIMNRGRDVLLSELKASGVCKAL